MYWDTVLREILNRNSLSHFFAFTNMAHSHRRENNTAEVVQTPRLIKRYPLGSTYPGVYFTQRETECMLGLLSGKTINQIAEVLKLSSRTIEFYLKNMKIKVGCQTKSALISKVLSTDFLACFKE